MSRAPVVSRLQRLPRRPFGRPEALKALASVSLFAGFVALVMPPLRMAGYYAPGELPVPVLSEAQRVVGTALGFLTGVLLWRIATEDARSITHGDRGPGSPRIARAVVLLCGLAAAALIPVYYHLKQGRRPSSIDEHLVVFGLGSAAIFLVLVGCESRARLKGLRKRARPPAPHQGPYAEEEALSPRGSELSGWQEALGPLGRPVLSGQVRAYASPSTFRAQTGSLGEIKQRVGPAPAGSDRSTPSESFAILGAALFTLLPLGVLLLTALKGCR